ncbi:hypothetical protein [Paludisphaera mucosa]|uniref:Uncharacterized protein n=1 Tax=Paludisphaera mucosa TaxID=3030827 RepID=A0ABT6FDS2_9BACT|nr:hypothetical protein [Paludisphaera mucosa]MDG3005515.1 hypothetical protein [Paludisphaera mucosa]
MTLQAAVSATSRLLGGWGPTIVVAAAAASAGVAWTTYRMSPGETDAVANTAAAGKSYPKALAAVYADAWRKGADALEAGRSVADALGVVGEAWRSGRTTLFDRVVGPAFAVVVPEGTPESDVSKAAKTQLASHWRAFAAGMIAAK